MNIPKRMRLPLDGDENIHYIQQTIDEFTEEVWKRLERLVKRGDLSKKLKADLKSFKNTDNTLFEIRCLDKVIATVYSSRTEFNNQEIVFATYFDTEVIKYIRSCL